MIGFSISDHGREMILSGHPCESSAFGAQLLRDARARGLTVCRSEARDDGELSP